MCKGFPTVGGVAPQSHGELCYGYSSSGGLIKVLRGHSRKDS